MSKRNQKSGLFAGVSGIDVIYHMDGTLPGKNEKKTIRDFEVPPNARPSM